MQLDNPLSSLATEIAIYHPLCVAPDTSVSDALNLLGHVQGNTQLPSCNQLLTWMNEVIASCVLVMERIQLVGLSTKQDSVELVSSHLAPVQSRLGLPRLVPRLSLGTSCIEALPKNVARVTKQDLVELGLKLNFKALKVDDVMSQHLIDLSNLQVQDITLLNLFEQYSFDLQILSDRKQLLSMIMPNSIRYQPAKLTIEPNRAALLQQQSQLEAENVQLQKCNAELIDAVQTERQERQKVEAALRLVNQELEIEVEKRTTQLKTANEQLQQEITQRQRVEKELREALEREKELGKLKSRFICMTSHEFRTPLTAILGSTELLRHYSHSWTDNKKQLYFDRIQGNVQHMIQLLEDVLLLGKAEAGKLKFEPEKIDLVQFCRTLVAELQYFPGTKHTLVFSEQFMFTDVYMDEQLLRQILGNLLSNAIKYSSIGSTVRFTLACEDETVIFQIQDQGIGIPPEDLQYVFESFYRAKNVSNIAGTGLGLAIVKKAVDLHGGQISVMSEVGVGTTFTVKMPTVVGSW